MKTKLIFVALATLLLAGCSSDSKRIVDLNLRYMTAHSAPLQATDVNAQSQLAESATSVSQSLNQLSAMSIATHPKTKLPVPYNAKTIHMSQVTSIDWNGPLQPILRKIAQASNYKLRILGQKPPIPIIISLSMHNQPLASILRNVMFQAQEKARIKLYPSPRIIELRYYS